jgi:hypothetical protein
VDVQMGLHCFAVAGENILAKLRGTRGLVSVRPRARGEAVTLITFDAVFSDRRVLWGPAPLLGTGQLAYWDRIAVCSLSEDR